MKMRARIHDPRVKIGFHNDLDTERPSGEVVTYHSEELRQYAIEKYGPPKKPLNHYKSQWYRQDPAKKKEDWL